MLSLFLIAFSVTWFGGVHSYAYCMVYVAVLASGFVLFAKTVWKGVQTEDLTFHWNPGIYLFVGIGIWLALQVTPLPQPLVRAVSPESLVFHQMSQPASRVVVSGASPGDWIPLAIYVHPVRMSLLRWVVYGLFLIQLTALLSSRKRMNALFLFLLVIGCAESLYGMMEAYSLTPSVLWYPISDAGRVMARGTMINHNHFAALTGMILILATSGMAAVRTARRREAGFGRPGIRNRLAGVFSGDQPLSKKVFLLLVGAVTGLGLILSASRGGILAAGAGLLTLGALLVARRGFRRRGGAILLMCAVVALFALRTGVAHTEERFRRMDHGLEWRWQVTRSVLQIFDAFPWTGIGVGNFQYAFPKYQPGAGFPGYYLHGHNDWAQFLSEAGLAGALILLSGAGVFLLELLRRWGRRRDPYAVCLGAGGVAVLAAVAVHATAEFQLRTPGVFLTLCAVLALALSALRLERRRQGERLNAKKIRIPWYPAGFLLVLLIGGFILLNGTWTLRHFVAEAHCNTVSNSTLTRDPLPAVSEIEKAIAWDSGNAAYWYKLALALIRERDGRPVKARDAGALEQQTRIVGALEAAVGRNPMECAYHARLGWEYTRLWKRPDYHDRWLPAADLSMERAAYVAGKKNPYLHEEIGNYWVMRSKVLSPADERWNSSQRRASWHYRAALDGTYGRRAREMRERIENHIWTFYPDKDLAEAFLD